MTAWLLPALAGFAAGILSAWGIGGGTLLLMLMTLFLGVDAELARGINLLYFLPTAAAGVYGHCKNGYLDKAVLRAAIPLGTLCALAAALAATSFDAEVLQKPFGLFLLWAGTRTLFAKEEAE